MKLNIILVIVGITLCITILSMLCNIKESSSAHLMQVNTSNNDHLVSATNDSDDTPHLAKNQVLKVSSYSPAGFLDPQLSSTTGSFHMLNNIFEGLVREKDGEISAGIAERWDISKDYCTYTFHLRKSNWSDGTPLTAHDFEYAWKRGINPETDSSCAYIFGTANILNAAEILSGTKNYKQLGVRALDDYTLEVKLTTPTEYFLSIITNPIFFPVKEDIVTKQDDWLYHPATAVSNGPFIFSKGPNRQTAIYLKSKNYWDAENITLDEVDMLIADANSGICSNELYESGKVNFDILSPESVTGSILNDDEVHSLPITGTTLLAFNFDNPVFTDLRVRKALSISINREEYDKSEITVGSEIAYGLVSDAFKTPDGSTFSDLVDTYGLTPNGNVDEALKSLSQAGYSEINPFPEIRIYVNDNQTAIEQAEYLKQFWKQNLNINLNIKIDPWDVYINNLQAETAVPSDLMRISWCGDYNDPLSILEIFETNNPNNVGHYSNEAFDQEIAKARTKHGLERTLHLRNAHNILMQDYALIPTTYANELIRCKRNIIDWQVTGTGLLWLGNTKIVDDL